MFKCRHAHLVLRILFFKARPVGAIGKATPRGVAIPRVTDQCQPVQGGYVEGCDQADGNVNGRKD